MKVDIKMNNYYFESTGEIDSFLESVIKIEVENVDMDNIKYVDKEYEDNLLIFTVNYFDKPIAIVSILDDNLGSSTVINYKSISNLSEVGDFKISDLKEFKELDDTLPVEDLESSEMEDFNTNLKDSDNNLEDVFTK